MNYIKSILFITLLTPTISHALQRIYVGNIGQNKVEFYFNSESAIYLDDEKHQVYSMSSVKGRNSIPPYYEYSVEGSTEKRSDKIFIESFTHSPFSNDLETYQKLTGYTLINGDKVNLNKIFEFSEFVSDEEEFNNIDYLQERSTNDFYFKVIVSKQKNEKAKIVGIKIYSKKDGRLIQTIKGIKGCAFNSYVSIMTHDEFDINFDSDNNDFYLVKDRIYGPNTTAEYYAYDKTQQQFIKLNLEGNDFRFDYEKKIATSYKYCPGKKEDDEISLTDTFQYIGNNRYKRIETKCTYQKGEDLNMDGQYEKERACKPKELINCRNYIDTYDYDD